MAEDEITTPVAPAPDLHAENVQGYVAAATKVMLYAFRKTFFTVMDPPVAATVYGAVIETVPPVCACIVPLKIVLFANSLALKGDVFAGNIFPIAVAIEVLLSEETAVDHSSKDPQFIFATTSANPHQ